MPLRVRIAKIEARYDRGGPLFFLILPLDLGAQDLSAEKTDLMEKTKTAVMPDEKYHDGPSIGPGIMAKIKCGDVLTSLG